MTKEEHRFRELVQAEEVFLPYLIVL